MQYGNIRGDLQDYRRRWPGEAAAVDGFLALLEDPHDPFVRERLAGHFTGSAWVVSADGQRFVMVKDESSSSRLNVVLNWFEELKARVNAQHAPITALASLSQKACLSLDRYAT